MWDKISDFRISEKWGNSVWRNRCLCQSPTLVRKVWILWRGNMHILIFRCCKTGENSLCSACLTEVREYITKAIKNHFQNTKSPFIIICWNIDHSDISINDERVKAKSFDSLQPRVCLNLRAQPRRAMQFYVSCGLKLSTPSQLSRTVL